MLGQSLGSAVVAGLALAQFLPDVFIDTTGDVPGCGCLMMMML
jgi:hypothetical protein